MKNAFGTGVVLACFLAAGSSFTQAQPAIYRAGDLDIAQGILIENGKDQYFSKIKLRTQPNGSLRIVRAQQRPLITLDELELNQVYGPEPFVELQIKGFKSMPCVGLEPVAVRRIDNTFHVLIAEGSPDPLALCAQMLTPVDVNVDLELGGLPAGDYVVLINNEPMEFTLEDLGE